jgi:hypothetical protein
MVAVVGSLAAALTVARAEWTPPTDDQVLAAAQDTSKLPALLQGASDAQAASVVSAVLIKAASLGLSTADLTTRTTDIVTVGMQGRTEAGKSAIATAVGTTTAATPSLDAISTSIGQAVRNAGGAAALVAFNHATVAGGGTPGGSPPQSPRYVRQ